MQALVDASKAFVEGLEPLADKLKEYEKASADEQKKLKSSVELEKVRARPGPGPLRVMMG